MGIVLLDMAMSLDGLVSGPNAEDHGLHDYFFSPSSDSARVIEEGFKMTGAIIMGRRSYDIGAKQDGFADNPYQVPTFIVSSNVPEKLSKGAEGFVFVTDGIERALRRARAAAGDREVVIGGGVNTAHQFLKAGLVDEIQIHLVHILMGEGKPLFDPMGGKLYKLERIRVVDAPGVTHLRFRVVK